MFHKLKELFFVAGGTRRTVFKNFLWLSVGQMGSRVVRASITLYAARALGASQYGVFSYAIGLAGFFIFFKNIGVDLIMTRDIAKDPASREKIFSTGFWIEIILLIITALLLIFIAPHFSKINEAIVLLPIVAIMLIADDLRDFFFAFFRGVEKMEWEAIVVTIGNVLVTAFGFAALAYANTPLSLIGAYAAASVTATIISGGIIFLRYGAGVVRKFSSAHVIPILSGAWPIAVSALPAAFLFNTDLVMLGWWWPASDVGVYSAAQKVVGILAIFPQLIATSTMPVFSRFASQHDDIKTKSLVESTLRIMFAFSIPLVAGGALLGTSLLMKIFGAEYSSGNVALAILLGTVFASYPLMILINFAFARNALLKIVRYPFIAAGINIALNALLVPRYGMIGASLATLVSFGMYAFFIYRFARQIVPFSFFPKPMKIIFSAIMMVLVTIALQSAGVGVVMNIGISALLYLAALYLLKEEAIIEVLSLIRK